MTIKVNVSRFCLTVDARETMNAMINNAENRWGRRLHDALTFAIGADCAYTVPPYAPVTLEDFRPGVPERSDLVDVEDRCVEGVLHKLHTAGYLTMQTVWSETSSEGYLSEGRRVTAVHVLRAFVLVTVQYRFSPQTQHQAWHYGHACPDQPEITDRSYRVPTGWYLVGETGDYTSDLVGVAGMDGHCEDLCWLLELDGFGASRCAAECDTCRAHWLAESGSWHFHPEGCQAPAWNFDDADEIDENTNTVACPACTTGRVGFLIF